MAQATNSRGGGSKTQVQAESIDSPDSESAKNHPEVSKGEESQIGNPEVSSREKRRHRASLARHSRKCSVCHHPDREFIDDDYLRWISPETIARQYKISHHSVVYRHADATGLRTQRRAALRATLEHFIEQAENVRVTAHSIVSAVRLYSQINDQGQYTPTARRHIVEHHYFGLPVDAGTEPPGANPAGTAADAASAAPAAKTADAQRAATQGTPGAAKVETKDGLPSPFTSAATSAAPLSESKNEFGAVSPASGMAGRSASAASTTPVGTVDFRDSNAAASQAATSAATSAAPFGESQESFPAVAVSVAAAPAPTKSKTTATPIATIYLQTNAISNRELLGLEHAATH